MEINLKYFLLDPLEIDLIIILLKGYSSCANYLILQLLTISLNHLDISFFMLISTRFSRVTLKLTISFLKCCYKGRDINSYFQVKMRSCSSIPICYGCRCRWIYSQVNMNGFVEGYKFLFVVKDSTYVPGVDYFETSLI